MTLAEKIRFLRKQAKMTQTELGEKFGVQKNAVSKWECGRVEDIPRSKLIAMAELFDVDPSYFLDERIDEPFPKGEHPLTVHRFTMPELHQIPLLGTIACGTPVLASENTDGTVDMPDRIHADFALRCKGDSMINARIFDGDIVYIRQQDTVENGTIAAVLIGDEATLKRVRLYDDHVVLEPENPMYRPMCYWNEEMNSVHILGKAVAFTSTIL